MKKIQNSKKTSNEIVLQNIKKLYHNNRLIPFIGSGFSSSVAPQWDAFIEELFPNNKRILKQIPDNLELLEYFVITKTKKQLLQHIDNRLKFSVTCKDGDNPSKVLVEGKEISLDSHDLLCEKFNDRIIYTTNWDNLIEEVGNFKPIMNRIESLDGGCNSGVIKFHGSVGQGIKNYGDELIACKTDYWKRITNITPFDILFQSDYIKNYFLFIGYSLRDINVSLTIYQLMKLINSNKNNLNEKRIYWVVTEPKNDKRVRVLSKHSNIVPYYLLTDEDTLLLKKIKKKLDLKCKKCKIGNMINQEEAFKIGDNYVNIKELCAKDACNYCKEKKDSDDKYKDEWNRLINDRTIEFLNII